MTTDTMREKFEEYGNSRSWSLIKDSIGIYENLEVQYAWAAYQAAYAQSQRDLLKKMGQPLAWLLSYPDSPMLGSWFAMEFPSHLSGVALYRLPEDAKK